MRAWKMGWNQQHLPLKAVTHQLPAGFHYGLPVVVIAEADRGLDKLQRVVNGITAEHGFGTA